MCCTEAHMADTKAGGLRTMAKVMVVDDAYSELQVMETILRSVGHDVLTYLDGEQLEEKIVKERPDVVLLDIVMPKRNGFEVLRSLRKDERTKQTRVVVVSSKNQESDRVWGMRQGADEYLPQPFTSEQLLTIVRRFLKCRRVCSTAPRRFGRASSRSPASRSRSTSPRCGRWRSSRTGRRYRWPRRISWAWRTCAAMSCPSPTRAGCWGSRRAAVGANSRR